MIKNLFKSKFVIISFSLISLLFIAIAFVQWSLIIGWLIGAMIGILNLAIGYWQVNKIVNAKNSKSFAIVITIFKFIFIILLNGGVIVGIIFSNKAFQNLPMFENSKESVYGPINLFTYIAAITYTKFATLTIYLMKGEKDDTKLPKI